MGAWDDAVGVVARQVGRHQVVGDGARLAFRAAYSLEDFKGDGVQVVVGESGHGASGSPRVVMLLVV